MSNNRVEKDADDGTSHPYSYDPMKTSKPGAAGVHMAIRSLAIVAFAALVSGCAQDIVKYPSNWAPIDSQLGCSAIAGMYKENGERAPGAPRGGFLRFTHLATHDEVNFRGPYVTLSFPEADVFLIRAGGERRFRFKEGEAACDSDKLQLRRSRSGPTIAGGPARTYETVMLARSTDGWLIAEWERTEWLLLAGIIPTYSRIVEWYRFEPVRQPG